MKILSNAKYKNITDEIEDLRNVIDSCNKYINEILAESNRYESAYEKERIKNEQLKLKNNELHTLANSLLKEKESTKKRDRKSNVVKIEEQPQPKKRGRKPKNSIEEPKGFDDKFLDEPKKRGRKPKSTVEKKEEK